MNTVDHLMYNTLNIDNTHSTKHFDDVNPGHKSDYFTLQL